MKPLKITVTLAALLAAGALPAADIYRCEVDGHVTFSQTPCGGGAQRIEVDISPTGVDGLRPGERAMLDDVNARDEQDLGYKRYKADQYQRHHVGFSDRQRIKKLENDRRRLQESLDSGASVGKSWSVKTEIDGINRQIEQIRSPKW